MVARKKYYFFAAELRISPRWHLRQICTHIPLKFWSESWKFNKNTFQNDSLSFLLQVYYVGEVGTGLGPTLEFYTLLSHAFQQSSLGMWRENGSYTANGKTYVSAPNGFYPSEFSLLSTIVPLSMLVSFLNKSMN